jgi:hypothetical protein
MHPGRRSSRSEGEIAPSTNPQRAAMAKYKHLFHRSEYQIALHNYRRARRRGDVANAQRWLKAADMHLRVDDRFQAGLHAGLMREIEYEEAKLRDANLRRENATLEKVDASSDAYASLERLMDKVDRTTDEELEEEFFSRR